MPHITQSLMPYPICALKVSGELEAFVKDTCALVGEKAETFWNGLKHVDEKFSDENERLLSRREEFQAKLDEYEIANRQSSKKFDEAKYKAFLKSIGYLEEDQPDFSVTVENVDKDISKVCGPQLVVPLSNPRYTVNAANARWVSLYDALYATDAMDGSLPTVNSSNDVDWMRSDEVVRHVGSRILDAYFPLVGVSYNNITDVCVNDGRLSFGVKGSSTSSQLHDRSQFVGFQERNGKLTSFVLVHNFLHFEIVVDRSHPLGKRHPAGIKDVIVEAAVTTILDMEDSVAAVDASDKVSLYSNLVKMFTGTLAAEFEKNGKAVYRVLKGNREMKGNPENGCEDKVTLPGRSLLFVRIVGRHMYTHSVLNQDGKPIPECFLDAMVTVLASLVDLRRLGLYRNSTTKSIYVVVPKHHGSAEVEATVRLFSAIEDIWNLPRGTVKLGIMDEERRTSLNLKQVIHAASSRIVFINTGFLDRTGDEIRSCTYRGMFFPKGQLKSFDWFQAYEQRNVQIALSCGMMGRAQIGKGMWAMPELMHSMMATKIGHPMAGASCAWVPSPTAAALHALHYHQVDVVREQGRILDEMKKNPNNSPLDIDALLHIPICTKLNRHLVDSELSNNIQSILGYVVRWIDQGIGCSKIPDINGVGLMEDRATLRISSQLLANWLLHDVITVEQVDNKILEIALIVDKQNESDVDYKSLSVDRDGNIAVSAARSLIVEGKDQPNGYTEYILHKKRQAAKEHLH